MLYDNEVDSYILKVDETLETFTLDCGATISRSEIHQGTGASFKILTNR